MSNILELDIETAPGIAYIWSMFDTFVPLERLIEPSRVICAAYKWHGKKGVTFLSEWGDGRDEMLSELAAAISMADAVITYNGDKFDLPKLQGEFVRASIDPPAPPTSIDLYKAVKKLGYQSNKLEFIGPYLGIGRKVEHAGFKLWRDVLAGSPSAQKEMERYNVQDVILLGRLYNVLKPYISNHPYLHNSGPVVCSTCGHWDLRHRGYRYTRTMKIERLRCHSCGHWDSGKRSKKAVN